ncbi:MAG: hypothetical protein DMF03_02440 [Verrucomicrobia bacterium]|nr:MAG: hypothetical protein DMF03_02440 [Verrucomicrobiota bacterium]
MQGSKTRLQRWLGDFCKAILVIGARKEVGAAPLVIIFCTGGHRAAATRPSLPKYRRYSQASTTRPNAVPAENRIARKCKLGGDLAEIGAYNESFKES